MGTLMTRMLRQFLAMAILGGLIWAVLPISDFESVGGFIAIHNPVDRAKNHTPHGHGDTQPDDCHGIINNCSAGAPVIGVDLADLNGGARKTLQSWYRDSFRNGLQPLPLLPPPETA